MNDFLDYLSVLMKNDDKDIAIPAAQLLLKVTEPVKGTNILADTDIAICLAKEGLDGK